MPTGIERTCTRVFVDPRRSPFNPLLPFDPRSWRAAPGGGLRVAHFGKPAKIFFRAHHSSTEAILGSGRAKADSETTQSVRSGACHVTLNHGRQPKRTRAASPTMSATPTIPIRSNWDRQRNKRSVREVRLANGRHGSFGDAAHRPDRALWMHRMPDCL